MFFFLLAGHALADYPLQNEAMATCKNRRANLPLQKSVPWYYWMAAHALIHGGTVGVIVRWWEYSLNAAILIGIMETVIHIFIDIGKCERLFGIAVDQALHIICKAVWCLLLVRGFIT